jgi:hypothetical protein
MYDIIKVHVTEFILQLTLTAEVQFYEIDTFISQELARTATANGCPCVHATAKRLFYYE